MTPTPGPLIAQGRTAEVYAWPDNQVLKLFYPWCPPDWVQHEVDIGQVISQFHLPAPKLIGQLTMDGRQGILYERLAGPAMLV
jgi:hypothetical protein